MYPFLLHVHSLVRWAVLGAGGFALAASWWGWLSGRRYGAVGRRSAAAFTAALDLQLLLGLTLYFLASPISRAALAAPAAALGQPQLRYWFLEHPLAALAAVALGHVGSVRSRRALADSDRWRQAAVFFTLACVALAAAVPWPTLSTGRPLWPF